VANGQSDADLGDPGHDGHDVRDAQVMAVGRARFEWFVEIGHECRGDGVQR
jgi:hypothetical protein